MLDKAVAILGVVAEGPHALSGLVELTGIPRPTAHRLAVALEHHGLLSRDDDGQFHLGPWLAHLGAQSADDRLLLLGRPLLAGLRDATGLSAQLYRPEAGQRRCVATAEPTSGLRDTVPVGSLLTMRAGSAAQVLAAWGADAAAVDAFPADTIRTVRDRGWAWSTSQREQGVASVSAAVLGGRDVAIAAVSLSGPERRFQSADIPALGARVRTAADTLRHLVLGQ